MSNTHRPKSETEAERTARWVRAYHAAFAVAIRAGVKRQDASDCALDLLLDFVTRHRQVGDTGDLDVITPETIAVNGPRFCATWYQRESRRASRQDPYVEPHTDESGEPSAPITGQYNTPEEAVLKAELVARILQVVSELSHDQQVLFRLLCMDGNAPTEVAQVLGISTKALYDRIRRIKKTLVYKLNLAGLTLLDAQEYISCLR
jgi:RNA polymerase sigma factor (sigma-70 family)